MPGLLLTADWIFLGTGDVVADGAVLIEDGVVRAAGARTSVSAAPDTDTRHLADCTLMPGMIDAHVHLVGERQFGRQFPNHALEALRAAEDARKLLMSGFTTVRDCGSAVAIALRDAITEGTVVGPTILAAGAPISQTGGHTDWHSLPYHLMALINDRIVVDGEVECRKAVRRLIREKADLIKICTTGGVGTQNDHMLDEHFTVPEISAIVDEAHRAGRRVASHAQGKAGVLNAIRCGVDTIEHGYFADQECVDEMIARGTMLVPTFGLADIFRESLKYPEQLPPWRRAKQAQCVDAMLTSFPLAWQSGVSIAVGSDSFGAPGREFGKSANEVISMVRTGGVPEVQALMYATAGGARALGIEGQAGELLEGSPADVIAVRGRPDADITALRDIAMVLKNGEIVRDDTSDSAA